MFKFEGFEIKDEKDNIKYAITTNITKGDMNTNVTGSTTTVITGNETVTFVKLTMLTGRLW